MDLAGKPTLGIVGTGMVGSTLGILAHARGYRVAALHNLARASAVALSTRVGAAVLESAAPVLAACDLLLVAVPDDALGDVAAALEPADVTGKGIVHTSGVRDASVFAALAPRGARVGSLHPAYPFADVDTAVAGLPGATFAVEAEDPALRAWLLALVAGFNGRAIVVPPGGKALYHAALVIASNYAVTLYALAEELLRRLGADAETSHAALGTLLAGTVRNIEARGIPDALTGPIARGDAGTVAAHLDALARDDGALAALYVLLAQATLPLARARGVAVDAIAARLDRARAELQE